MESNVIISTVEYKELLGKIIRAEVQDEYKTKLDEIRDAYESEISRLKNELKEERNGSNYWYNKYSEACTELNVLKQLEEEK